MMNSIKKMAHAAKSFVRNEDGTSTIEFMMVLPAAMFFGAASYEVGNVGVRQMMLERAVDVTVREVRIGNMINPTHGSLKQAICDAALIIPNCVANLTLDMERKNPRQWEALSNSGPCINTAADADAVLEWSSVGNNDLMVLRACADVDALIPGNGIGTLLTGGDGDYDIVATSSYVVEPYQ